MFVNVFHILGVPVANVLISVSFFFNAYPLLRSECKSSLFKTNSDSNPIAAFKQTSVCLTYVLPWLYRYLASALSKSTDEISKSVFLRALKTLFLFQFIATYFRKVDYSRFWSP